MGNLVQPQIAVSYSWKEEREGPNAGAVGEFCQHLSDAGIPVVRDKDRLKHGECISAFMRDIGASKFLCIFLSDSYLKSPNCMYELLVAWLRNVDNTEEFLSRVKVWVMPSAKGIYDSDSRLAYLKHWKAKREHANLLITEHAKDGLSGDGQTEFTRINGFTEHVDEILCIFAKTRLHSSLDEFQAWVIEQFPKESAAEAQLLQQVYRNTTDEIESLLNGNSRLCKFIADSTTSLICQGGRWKLCEPVGKPGFLIAPYLKDIKTKLAYFGGMASDWQDLEVFVGGIVVMAIDPLWILSQRKLLNQGSLEYPALKEFVPTGSGQRAQFLHLVTTSLADGHARLHRVFGEPQTDEKRVPDPAVVARGIGEPDRTLELKLHFIRFIVGPDVAIDVNDPKKLALLFKQANDLVRYAFKEEREPYFGCGPVFLKLAETIRNHLKMEDLVLIQPSGAGSEDEILPDTLFVLKHLGEIFEVIKKRRTQPAS